MNDMQQKCLDTLVKAHDQRNQCILEEQVGPAITAAMGLTFAVMAMLGSFTDAELAKGITLPDGRRARLVQYPTFKDVVIEAVN